MTSRSSTGMGCRRGTRQRIDTGATGFNKLLALIAEDMRAAPRPRQFGSKTTRTYSVVALVEEPGSRYIRSTRGRWPAIGNATARPAASPMPAMQESSRTFAHRPPSASADACGHRAGGAVKALARQQQEAVWAMQDRQPAPVGVVGVLSPGAAAFPNLPHKADSRPGRRADARSGGELTQPGRGLVAAMRQRRPPAWSTDRHRLRDPPCGNPAGRGRHGVRSSSLRISSPCRPESQASKWRTASSTNTRRQISAPRPASDRSSPPAFWPRSVTTQPIRLRKPPRVRRHRPGDEGVGQVQDCARKIRNGASLTHATGGPSPLCHPPVPAHTTTAAAPPATTTTPPYATWRTSSSADCGGACKQPAMGRHRRLAPPNPTRKQSLLDT